MRFLSHGAIVALLLWFGADIASCQEQDQRPETVEHNVIVVEAVSIVRPVHLPAPAHHGIEKLCQAIRDHHVAVNLVEDLEDAKTSHVIVAGLNDDSAVASVMTAGGSELPGKPESLAVRQVRTVRGRTVALCGADAVGLMYAALDTADRISWAAAGEDLFAHVRDTSESPFMLERSVSTYTMHRGWFEQRLHDPSYWESYFDMLAANRINSYVIIFGYECGGFMAPFYPYFFDVDGFPQIRFNGLTKQQQTRNAEALTRVIELAHGRGIRVSLGIWDHIYRGRVQAGGIPWAPQTIRPDTPHAASGVTAENLAPYTKAALEELIEVFPEIDGIQFRMHGESGLTHREIPAFWRDVFSMLRQLKPSLTFDLRAKGLPDQVIANAIEEELPFRIATKFWMEQIGMSFHPTHVNPQNQRDRRHGYADLLRFPQQYDVHWRVWSAGSLRMLLWGNPEHVRRFVTESATVYGGKSFEVNEMLATKMLGRPHDEQPFSLHRPAYRHYDHEIERYWHFFQLWGRVGYDPEVSEEIWRREFVGRFGESSGPVLMRALHQASSILPTVVAASSHYEFFPTTRGWVGMMRMGDMPQYAAGTGTDVEQFQSYEDAARLLIDGGVTSLRTPQQSAARLQMVARRVLHDVADAVAIKQQRSEKSEREFQAAVTDLKILANLAQYHAARMPAAVWYNVYLQTQDRFALQQCLSGEAMAIAAWKKIIENAEGVYSDFLPFGSEGAGFPRHWKTELVALEAGYKELQEHSSEDTLDAVTRERLLRQVTPRDRCPLTIDVERVLLASAGQRLIVRVTVKEGPQLQSIRLRYRHLSQFEDYQTTDMIWDAGQRKYVGVIPGNYVMPQWDMLYFVEAIDQQGRGIKLPDLDNERPYVIVSVAR